MAGNMPYGMYKQMSASANVNPASGFLVGIFVSAASAAPTITVYDSASTTTTTKIIDTFTPVAATWYPMALTYSSGCYIVIGGTVSMTAVYS